VDWIVGVGVGDGVGGAAWVDDKVFMFATMAEATATSSSKRDAVDIVLTAAIFI